MPRRSSPKKGQLVPWTATDSNSNSKFDFALESSLLVVETLQNIGSMSGVPFLNEAAGIVLRILTIVKDVRNHNQDFTDLASDACGLVYTILIECQSMIKDGQTVPERVQGHILLLARNLSEIEKFARKKLDRGPVTKIIYHSKDLDQITRYRTLLRQCLDVFGIQSNISIQENLRRVLQNIEKQGEELKADRARQEQEKRRAEDDLASRLEILRLQEEDHQAERLRVQREIEEYQRREPQRMDKTTFDELRKGTQNTRLSPEREDVPRPRTKRTPSLPKVPIGQFYHPHPGYPLGAPMYPSIYPGYPASPYILASPIMSPPNGTSMSNVSGSGISLGGGPVHVTNWNSGNVSNTVIKNSMNTGARPRRDSRTFSHMNSF